MHITPLTAAHVTIYRSLMLQAYAAAPEAFTSTPEERAAEPASWWLARIGHAQALSRAFGAFDAANELQGTVALEFSSKPKTQHKAHLIGMYVSAAARGQGMGRALMQAALAAAAERPGLRMVTLTVTEGNAPALALYQSCGFQVFGIEPMAIALPEGFKGKVHMWREVAAAPGLPTARNPTGALTP